MAAGKELLGSYSPKMVHAGDYPVVTDSGTVAEGNTILELMPVTLGEDGKIYAVTAESVENVYGLAAENANEGEEVVYYLTGQFFGDSLELPTGTTPADFKAPFRKIGIFLVDTENKGTQPTPETYTITQTLEHVTSNLSDVSVEAGSGVTATLEADNGYTISTVSVTMGGSDITSTAYSSGTGVVSIDSASGNIVITATATN